MTPRQRVFLAVTVLMVLTVTGVVIGCDSDDTPTVTAPSGGSGSGTPTRNMTAEQQGRDGLEETENGTMIRNTGEVALNVRFNYDDPRHYRLNADTAMPSDPANAGSAPARVACGVPATGRANGQCFNNDGVTAPEPYRSSPGGGQPNPGTTPPNAQTNSNGWDAEWALHCLSESGKGTDNHMVTNSCGAPHVLNILAGCPAAWYEPDASYGGLTTYNVETYLERPLPRLTLSEPTRYQHYPQFKNARSVNTHWPGSGPPHGVLGPGDSADVRGDLCKRQAESDEPQGPGVDPFPSSKAVTLIACFGNRPERVLAGGRHNYRPYFLTEVQSEINDGASYRWGCYDQFRGNQ